MKTISNNSRYQLTPEVSGERLAEWVPIRFGQVAESVYTVTEGDLNRPDLISYRNYGVCDLWWAIFFHNDIIDPFSIEVGDKLVIPSIDDLTVLLATARTSRLQLRDAEVDQTPESVPIATFPVLPLFRRVLTPAEILAVNSGATPTLTDRVVTVFDLSVPENLVGSVHFQLQVSNVPDFSTIVLNRFTLTTQANWYFYNPAANNAAGGYVAFPPAGLDGIIYEGQRVYLNIFASDNLASGTEYYARYRTWINNTESSWSVAPPIIF